MFLNKLKLIAALVSLLALIGSGLAIAVRSGPREKPSNAVPAENANKPAAPAE
jgi:hypothetical protein